MRPSRNLPLSRSQLEEVRTELSHVVQVRAEGPKAPEAARPEGPKVPEAARPERAEAPSPGHRPGYNGNQQGAL